MDEGIIVGCDCKMEWLLPWWWKNYSAHNSYPVVFFDFGMSKKGIAWCKSKGRYIPLTTPEICLADSLSSAQKQQWDARYGKGFWKLRSSWFKKPFAFLQSPFVRGLWLDLDCQVRDSLQPLFHSLMFGDIALVPDIVRNIDNSCASLKDEVQYNSGVIAFQKDAPVLQKWADAIFEFQDQLPSDQEILSRVICTQRISVLELPLIYNWHKSWGENEEAIIHHYSGGPAKIEIFKSYPSILSARESALIKTGYKNLESALS